MMLFILRLLRAIVIVPPFLLMALVWLILPDRPRRIRRWIGVRGWGLFLWGFSIRLTAHGTPLRQPGTLYVCNHVSWADIAVMTHLLDANFVAKAEVADWPLLGTLARRGGVVFIERQRRAAAKEQALAVADMLAKQELVLFPEGTTGDGIHLLPFRSSLFPDASGAQVQPVCLHYRAADGQLLAALHPDHVAAIAWLSDDGLVAHIGKMLRVGGCRVDVWFETPFAAQDRKKTAALCSAIIADRLRASRFICESGVML